jgi:hypothetical protein
MNLQLKLCVCRYIQYVDLLLSSLGSKARCFGDITLSAAQVESGQTERALPKLPEKPTNVLKLVSANFCF